MAQQPAALSWSDYAAQRLAGVGYRSGVARQAVLDLLGRQGCALSAFEIEAELDRSQRRVARASIYRVLEELEQLKLVGRVEVGQGIARFEPLHPGGDHHHHHFVCNGCGELVPFSDDELEKAIDRVALRLDFDVSDHDITLRGSCRACQAS